MWPIATRFLLAFVGLFGVVDRAIGSEPMPYRLTVCEDTEQYVGLRFERGTDGSRTVVFMDQDHEFAVQSPTSKGILNWSNVIDVRLMPGPDDTVKFSEIVYVDKYDKRQKTFEMGLMDDACLTKLKARYGKYLKFVGP